MPSATGVLSKPARQTSEVFGEATRVCNPAWSRAELVCFLQAIELGRLLSTSPLPILVHVGGNATHVSCFEGIARLCQMLHPRSEGGDICHNLTIPDGRQPAEGSYPRALGTLGPDCPWFTSPELRPAPLLQSEQGQAGFLPPGAAVCVPHPLGAGNARIQVSKPP